jgi:hypothetical protein
MLFYVDRLTWNSLLKALDIKQSAEGDMSADRIGLLDPCPSVSDLKSRVARAAGFDVSEVAFIAGRLRMVDGQPTYIAARRHASEVAILQASEIIRRSPLLNAINRECDRNTVLLHLARFLWNDIAHWFLRRYVAEALFRDSGEKAAILMLPRPDVTLPCFFENTVQGLRIECYRQADRTLRQRLFPWLWLIRQQYRKSCWRMQRGRNKLPSKRMGDAPSLLLLHEEELSPDRSYRTQPHWLEPEDPALPFRTFIVQPEISQTKLTEDEALSGSGISAVPLRTWALCRGGRSSDPLHQRLLKTTHRLLYRSIVGRRAEVPAVFPLVRLFDTASDLAAFCSEASVKLFMTCENYLPAADAMQIIAGPLGIRTLSYQYSNMSHVGPAMMTTADIMVTFSPLYHTRWTHPDIAPRQFHDMGYLFDAAFKRVRERAVLHRKALMNAGARFILSFFDENAFRGKYELVLRDDLIKEIHTLLKLVIDNSSWGLVIKSQFQRHSPVQFPELAEIRGAAKRTGRYLELSHGVTRNIVFPAEAAMISDMALAHAVGATAALESALAGTRTILLNPYAMKTDNDPLYERADIVYASLASALKAIDDYRAGHAERARLGDWSPILRAFDPYADGNAAKRLRALLEKEMAGSARFHPVTSHGHS